jgi:hypothetical protein
MAATKSSRVMKSVWRARIPSRRLRSAVWGKGGGSGVGEAGRRPLWILSHAPDPPQACGRPPPAMAIRTPNDGESGEKTIWRGLVRPDDLVTRWKMASRGPPWGFVGTASLLWAGESASGLPLRRWFSDQRESEDRVISGMGIGPPIDFETGRGSAHRTRSMLTMTRPLPSTANFADIADSAEQTQRASPPRASPLEETLSREGHLRHDGLS